MIGNENKMGFGRGWGVDQKQRFKEELREVNLERAEEEEAVNKGLRGFASAMDEFNLEQGGDWASDYEALTNHVDRDAIESAEFWRRVFQKYGSNVTTHGLFASLPPELQRDPKIQEVFLGQEHFSLNKLSRTALENLGRDNVVEELLRDHGSFGMERVPWDLFLPEEKRRFVFQQVEQNKVTAGGIRPLNKVRDEFSDVVSNDEWREILNERLAESEWELTQAVKEDLESLQKQFSNALLRELLKKTATWDVGEERPIYFGLDLPTLRKLEFSEDEIDLWKEQYDENAGLDDGFREYAKMIPEDRTWALQELPKRAGSLNEGYREYVSNKLPQQMQRLAAGVVEKTMRSVSQLIHDSYQDKKIKPEDVVEIIRSTIDAQGPSGFRALNYLNQRVARSSGVYQGDVYMVDHLLPDNGAVKVYKQIMSKTGARFQDFLAFYSDLRLVKDDRESYHLASEKSFKDEKFLLPYIESGLPWVTEIFEDFERRVESGERPEEVVVKLSQAVSEKIGRIRAGELPEGGLDAETKALLSHVFPPALGVSREEYSALVERRKDRQDDVPYALDALQGREVSFSLGNWVMKEGQEFETAAWDHMSEVVSDVNDKKIIAKTSEVIKPNEMLLDKEKVIDIGREMVKLLQRSSSTKTKELLRDLYALYLLGGGAKLPNFVTGREEGARMTEWAKDSLRDTIDVALSAYREVNSEKFDQEVIAATKRDVEPKARKKISGAITEILRSTSMSDQNKTERIRTMLERVGASVEGDVLGTFRELFEKSESRNPVVDIDNYVEELLQGAAGVGGRAGKLSPILVSKILGGGIDSMKSEMAKWQFVEGAEGGEQRILQFKITKKQLHAVAGMNMGVCVAVDDKLWDKQEFMNVVLFADDGVARGGMHFEIVHDGEKTFLSLPGINPSMTAFREVDAQKLTEAMLKFARDAAKAIGAESVLIPTNPAIFSNRDELHGIIADKKMPVRSLSKSHCFSYSPFAYEWQDAYEMPIEKE